MKIRLESLGCRLNLGEMESAARSLTAAGHRVVGHGEPAELCILNTCTVTATASRKSRQIIRQLRHANPGARLVATGCFTEMAPGAVEGLGLDLVVGNTDKDRLIEVLTENNMLTASRPGSPDDQQPTSGSHLRTRAFLKVQDGCDNRCAYCVVTLARGPGRSRPVEEVIADVHNLRNEGFNEVVLSGVHLGSYGCDHGTDRGLENLVRRILATTDLPRLRLSSLEPWDLRAGFFELFADPRLLPHIHLPLQSGCDSTLARMNRRTTQREFADLVEVARRLCPTMSISTDVIVGFPGESDAEFDESFRFVEMMEFSRLHIFRFSPRPGTAAATMPDRVRGSTARARSRRLHALAARLETRFNRRFEGETMDVLWERCEPHGDGLRWNGLTPNYIRITAETPATIDLLNTIVATRIVATTAGGVCGSIARTPALSFLPVVSDPAP